MAIKRYLEEYFGLSFGFSKSPRRLSTSQSAAQSAQSTLFSNHVKNKRGFFLTLIALLIVSLFVLYLQITIIHQSQPASVASAALSSSVTSFVNSMEEFYLPNIVSVTLASSLQGMSNYLAAGNQYVVSQNQSAIFYQMLTNGTVYPYAGTVYSNQTLNSLLPIFTSLVNSQLNIPLTLNFVPYQFTVYQETPWTVTVKMTFQYSINETDLVIANRTMQIFATVPITGLPEPYSLINTHGAYAPNITQTNISTWTIALFKQHIISQQFAANTIAPSYLNRLANVTTASAYGIEYFTDPSRFGYNVAPVNYSFVDYQFWTRPWNCTPYSANLFNITSISNSAQLGNFLVDDAHASKYMTLGERLTNVTLVCS